MDDHHQSSSEEISCSICLDLVHANGVRSVAKLKCGHEFHLDCIGSQFNMKGKMQCPNCREVEGGNWLYANGPTSSEPGLEEWFSDVETYNFLDTDMGLSYRWCLVDNESQTQPTYERTPITTNLFPWAYNPPPELLAHQANTRVGILNEHHHHHHQHHNRHQNDHHHQQQQQQRPYGMPSPDVPSTWLLLNSRWSSPEIPHDQGSSSSEAGHHFPSCWRGRDPIAYSDRDPIWGPPPQHRYGGSVQDSSGVRTMAPGEWMWS